MKDFFVSYTAADVAWAQWIAWILEEAGYTVHLQAWDFVPGSNWVAQMQEGTRAERTVVVLSEAYLTGSEFGAAEWQAAFRDDPQGAERKLIAIRIEDCERPRLLGAVVGLDVFGVDEASVKTRVLEGIAAALSGRAKPAQQPSFPGGAAKPAIKEGAAVPFPGDISRIWNVPPRNPNFTGRAAELESLRAGLTSGSDVVVQSVHGMGGLGKTQLAIEYAYQHAADYDLAWFIATEQSSLLADQFTRLAAALGLEASTDPETVRLGVQTALTNVPRWLLIFDNAELVAEVRPWIPAQPMAAGRVGHVVLTSRRAGFGAVGSVLDLDVISTGEAVTLLRTRIADVDDETAGRIAELLGNLPLAIEQAAAYLDQTQLPPTDYASLLETRLPDMLGRGLDQQRGETTVDTLWQLSMEQLATSNPAAITLIQMCAQFAPETIPIDLFAGHPDQLPEPLRAASRDPLMFNDVVAGLTNHSLVRRGPRGLTFHPLVLAAVRAHLGEDESRHCRAVSIGLLRSDLPGEIADAPQSWARWAELLPHVLAAASLIREPVGDDTDDLSWLLGCAGTYLYTHGRAREALPLIERELQIEEAAFGPDHSRVAAALGNQAMLLLNLGDASVALPLMERAMAIDEANPRSDQAAAAIRLSNLARLLQEVGNPSAAKPMVERAIQITEANESPDHSTLAILLAVLAMVLRDLGDPAGARPLVERALQIDEATYGVDHPRVAEDLSILGALWIGLDEPTKAQPLFERALTIDEAAYGPDHPRMAEDLSNVAAAMLKSGDPVRARPLFERALALGESLWGPDHPSTQIIRGNLTALIDEGPRGGPGRLAQE